jgi:hypothetical protein
VAALSLLLMGALLPLVLHRESPEAKLARVRQGMSLAEVEAVFGRPADSTVCFDHPPSEGAHQTRAVRSWRDARWLASVTFDENDRVQNKVLEESLEGPASITDVLKWLGLWAACHIDNPGHFLSAAPPSLAKNLIASLLRAPPRRGG